MRNVTKILCVVLALVVALSAASCTLTKQYSYKTDDVELPIGVYIYYLQTAYNEAQSLAQKSDKYDSEAGTYDGSKSFLKMEITDDDGVTAVAEQWITDKAAEYMDESVAIYHEYKALGATLDEATASYYESMYESYWDSISENYEKYGISYGSFIQAGITISLMRSAVFDAEYAVDGPHAVADDDLQKFFDENFTSYKYFSANLYTSVETPVTDADGNETTESTDTAMSDKEVKSYESTFKAYADKINNSGRTFDDAVNAYNKKYNAEITPTEEVKKLDEDTTDEIEKNVIGLKEGEAKYVIIGDDENSRQIYLIYKAPIADEKDYTKDSEHRTSVISEMKQDDFKELLKSVAAELTISKSAAMNNYKPSMFEA